MRKLAFSVAIGLLLVSPAVAAEPCAAPGACGGTDPDISCCARCGCHARCNKVCRVVCATEEVTKTVWTVQCKEFCVPKIPCGACGTASCGSCDQCACGKPCQAPPNCGPVRTKQELVKKVIVCKAPVYKCVVQNLCDNCCKQCAGQPAKGTAPAALGNLPASLLPTPPQPPALGPRT